MSIKHVAAVASVAFLLTQGAVAHHSHAMYDSDVEVTGTVTVKELLWTNPHVWLNVIAEDEDGHEVELELEAASPSNLARRGWNPKVVKPGEQVTVIYYPLKSGEPGGNLKGLTLGDGTVVM